MNQYKVICTSCTTKILIYAATLDFAKIRCSNCDLLMVIVSIKSIVETPEPEAEEAGKFVVDLAMKDRAEKQQASSADGLSLGMDAEADVVRGTPPADQ